MTHLNYSFLACGTKSNKIELLQEKAIRVLYSKSPIAHTVPLYTKRKQPNNLPHFNLLYTHKGPVLLCGHLRHRAM